MTTTMCRAFRRMRLLICLAATALGSSSLLAQFAGGSQTLHIRWEGATPDNGIHVPYILLAFHNGQVDVFDQDRPATELLAETLAAMRPPGSLLSLLVTLNETTLDPRPPPGYVGMRNAPTSLVEIGTPPPLSPRYGRATVGVSPVRHRFLSYVGVVQPADDAFVANEDPYQIELFDADGRFNGPLYIDVFGYQVMDAGLCANNETDLAWLDDLDPQAPANCADGEGVVHWHPGLNGSLRNPDGVPQRVLGGTFPGIDDIPPLQYDPVAADFSQPGYRLGRLVVTRNDGASRFAVSGSWYSPDRAGEGFNIEMVESEAGGGPPRMLVYWYTYEPDNSGRQVWLSGLADVEPAQSGTTRVELIRSEGGRFASTDNPELVERTPWGHVELRFDSCGQGHVSYVPLDPAWPAGNYEIYRLSPQIEGLGWLCSP